MTNPNTITVETIETDAGVYELEFISDPYGASNPLVEFDHEGMQFYVSDGTCTLIGSAGKALATLIGEYSDDVDGLERRYSKWRAIAASPWQLFTGSGYGSSQGHQWDWYVLVDVTGEHTSRIELAVLSTMAEYEAWETGDVFGYVLRDPSGSEIDACWGYYGYQREREYVISMATALARDDAAEKKKESNSVGAGFVGLI